MTTRLVSFHILYKMKLMFIICFRRASQIPWIKHHVSLWSPRFRSLPPLRPSSNCYVKRTSRPIGHQYCFLHEWFPVQIFVRFSLIINEGFAVSSVFRANQG